MNSLERYLPIDHEPHSKTSHNLYPEAMTELARPMPSVKTNIFRKFDSITGGFRPREFSILCGATGVGKTCLLANISSALIIEKVPHFVASVETGATDFIKRIMSVLAKKDLNGGDPVPIDQLKTINTEFGHLLADENLHLSLYDNRLPVEALMADIAWHVKHKGIKIAMIDNLNFLMEVTAAQNQVIEMDRVVHELVIFCKRIDVHVVMVMHPKKNDNGRVESEFDIKGSSTAVQEAHNVFLFNRVHPDLIKSGIATHYDRELKIAKMRRKGRFVGKYLIFNCNNGVSYSEGDIL